LRFTLVSEREEQPVPFEGIIDTGFTGFIQIPFEAALSLGINLSPLSISRMTLANGAVERSWIKQLPVTIHDETVSGLCNIPQSPNSPVLIGMDFLRKFERVLVVSSRKGVFLAHEKDVKLSQTPKNK